MQAHQTHVRNSSYSVICTFYTVCLHSPVRPTQGMFVNGMRRGHLVAVTESAWRLLESDVNVYPITTTCIP